MKPPLESSRQGQSRSAWYIFVNLFLTSQPLKQVKTWPQQKYTRQIWIRLVECSSSEISCPSEVPRFVSKLIFSSGGQADPRELDNTVLARTSDNCDWSFFF